MNKNDILEEFDKNKSLYDSLCSKTEQLIKELLNANGIVVHYISYRTKDRTKLRDKIVRKGNKYSSLNEITDVAGIRIITNFAEDVNKVAEIIKLEFDIDLDNTIDKRNHAEDKFGYMSMHYVVSMLKNRLKFTEYKPYKDLKIEIQIRSILQHGWAEIEHDLGYKGAKGIPSEFKRDFNRISALLETADKEFDRLREELSSYNTQVIKDITLKPEEFNINNSTLYQFLEQNKSLKELNLKIANFYNVDLNDNLQDINFGELSEKLKLQGIKTINELNNLLEKNKDSVINNFSKVANYYGNTSSNVSGVDRSVGLHSIVDWININV
ncbi:(p)ppGpp synthetase [bacterium]|nr:(p)ppGpp synthetase [bacterium]MBU1433812.1 (p)ppGpp synthetase [bacterium]MBU1503887.1 (p)ppGpp synthetase [bacterium]